MSSTVETRDVTLLLAVLPLLAVSDTVVNSIGMAALVIVVAPLAAAAFAPLRRLLDADANAPAALLLLAGLVACVEILLRAWLPDLYVELGVFTPLLIANVVILGAMTSADPASFAPLKEVVRTSVAIACMLLALGLARELVGRGSLLHDAGLMFGPWARALETKVFRLDMGFLLGMLPPGAFIALGVLLGLRNWIARSRLERPAQREERWGVGVQGRR